MIDKKEERRKKKEERRKKKEEREKKIENRLSQHIKVLDTFFIKKLFAFL